VRQRLLDRLFAQLPAGSLSGVRLVISEAHEGLEAAIAAVILGRGLAALPDHFLGNVP
jgi:hypothetical protein